MTTLICDCNQTMPLDPRSLGAALNENLTIHSTLCRREAGAFQKALLSGDDVVVACTQEVRLFGELAEQTEARAALESQIAKLTEAQQSEFAAAKAATYNSIPFAFM